MKNCNKHYFDTLAIRKGFRSDAQRGMIYRILKERRESKMD